MPVIDELDEYLSQDYNINYWSDDAILYAYELVGKLTSSEWRKLRQLWKGRPAQWQEYFVEILSRGEPREAIPVLLAIVEEAGDDLAITAAGSLRSTDLSGVNVQVSSHAVERLKDLARKRPGLQARVLEDLLAQLSPSH